MVLARWECHFSLQVLYLVMLAQCLLLGLSSCVFMLQCSDMSKHQHKHNEAKLTTRTNCQLLHVLSGVSLSPSRFACVTSCKHAWSQLCSRHQQRNKTKQLLHFLCGVLLSHRNFSLVRLTSVFRLSRFACTNQTQLCVRVVVILFFVLAGSGSLNF